MTSAFHDAWRAPAPSKDPTHSDILTSIFEWVNATGDSKNNSMVFWLHGEPRFATTAIAQSVAMRAQNEGRLLSSYFFSWTGSDESRNDPAHLMPTVMYKVALFDDDFLRRIARSIGTDRDIRNKEASTQMSVLLKRPFDDTTVLLPSRPVIVIDALDTCNDLKEPRVARDVSTFLRALVTPPFLAKLFITSRFKHPIRKLLESDDFLSHRSLIHTLSPGRRKDQPMAEPSISDADRGA
jgi:hypothetical protein